MTDPLDNIPVPPRPQQSRVIFQGRRYVAFAMRDGSLIVHDMVRGDGKLLIGKNAADWIEAIEHPMDADDAEQLCRQFLSN